MDCEIAKPSALRMFTVRVTRVVSYSLEFPFLLDVQRSHSHIWAASADVRLNSGGGIASARASLLVGVHGRLRRTLERELWRTPPPRSLVGAKFASAVLRKQAVLWSDSLQLPPPPACHTHPCLLSDFTFPYLRSRELFAGNLHQ